MTLRHLVRRVLRLLLESLDGQPRHDAFPAMHDESSTDEDLAEFLSAIQNRDNSAAETKAQDVEKMLVPLIKRVNAMWVELEMDFVNRLHVADNQDRTLCGSARGRLVNTPEEADCPDCLSITEHSSPSRRLPELQFTAVPHPLAWTMFESRTPFPMTHPQVGVLYHEWSLCKCPSCHTFLNALTSWGDSTMPSEIPLVGVCSACGTPFRLTPERTMEALSPEELADLAPEIIQTMQHVQALLNQ